MKSEIMPDRYTAGYLATANLSSIIQHIEKHKGERKGDCLKDGKHVPCVADGNAQQQTADRVTTALIHTFISQNL